MISNSFVFLGIRFVRRAVLPPGIQITSVVASLLVSVFLMMLLFSFIGIASTEMLRVVWWQPLQQAQYEVSQVAALLILCGLGAALCLRAQVMNLGAQGAFLTAVYGVGSAVSQMPTSIEPAGLWVLLGLVGGMCGALWMAVLALLFERAPRYLAQGSMAFALLTQVGVGHLVSPDQVPTVMVPIPSLAWLGVDLASGIMVALIVVLLAIWGMAQSAWGLRFKVRGFSIAAAQYAGLSDRAAMWIALSISGALAGLAGMLYVLTPSLALSLNHATNGALWAYGWGAIMAAWIGRNHPLGVVVVSLVFAVLMVGCRSAIHLWQLPDSLPLLLMGLMLSVFLAVDALMRFQIETEEEQ